MITSVTEGEDKPLKYPLMFRACELVVINKIDLLPHLDFDIDRLLANIDAVNPGAAHDAGQRPDGRGRRRASASGSPGVPARAGAPGLSRRGHGARPEPARRAARRAARTRTRRSSRPRPERLARCCHRMAERFARGGRLVAFGASPVARSDARHVAVEFVHPVIVGKRALPAIGARAARAATCAAQVAVRREPDDIAIAFGATSRAATRRARALARAASAAA